MTSHELEALLERKEDEHCEFKEAKSSFNWDKLVDYCVALANERGGRLILGVTDKVPRQVVGTTSFANVEDTKHRLLNTLRLRVEVDEIVHRDGRVVVFTVPSRPIGVAIHVEGRYLMRSGESLVPMSPDQLQRIFAESGPDFSVELCAAATLNDLDPKAVDVFRQKWYEKRDRKSVV